MIPILLLSLIFFLVLWWSYFGYFLFLRGIALFKPTSTRSSESFELPELFLIVCCFNEKERIEEKIENTKRLEYPREKLTVLFVDGGSSDGTWDILQSTDWGGLPVRLERTALPGKVNQFNAALRSVCAPIVVNSDADAILDINCLIALAREFMRDEKVGVVGAYCEPGLSCMEEKQYWQSQNMVRLLESESVAACTVVAPCYAFRRELVFELPLDVVADDIFISFAGLMQGFKVLYAPEARAIEARCPRSVTEMVRHKFRKCNAYITEILRFAHLLPSLRNLSKIVYLTRALQLVGVVWIGIAFTFMLAALFLLGHSGVVLTYLVTGAVSLLATHYALSAVADSGAKSQAGGFITSLRVFLLLTATILIAALAYPFYAQNSCYYSLDTKPA